MSQIVIWTGAKPQVLRKAVSEVIRNPIPHKIKEINSGLPKLNKGDVCLAMGTKACTELASLGMVAKNRKVGSLRGTPIPYQHGQILLTFDPNLPNIDYARRPDILWDCMLAVRLLKTGTTIPVVGNYTWVDDFKKTIRNIERLHAKTGKAVPISVDLETVGFNPYGKDVFIVSISVTYQTGQAHMIRFQSAADPKQPALRTLDGDGNYIIETNNQEILKQVEWLANSSKVKIYGANFKFDMNWMYVQWGLDNWPSFIMDTTLVGSLLDENRSNSLEMHAKLFTSMGGYDSEMNKGFDKGRMDLVPDDVLLTYGGGDTDAGLQVAQVFRKELLRNRRTLNFYKNLVHPATKAFKVIEQRGVCVDVPQYEVLRNEVQTEIDETQKVVLGMMSGRIKAKYRDNLKLSRTTMLKEFLFTSRGLNLKPMLKTEKGAISTSMEHFEMLASMHDEVIPFVKAMKSYNSASKTMSTYIVGFLKHLRPDGKYHPTHMLHSGAYGDNDEAGTNTGRTSAKDPAVQTIPKHTKWAKPLRKVFIPPPGYSILSCDYSQGELRIAACIANETTMIEAYRKGIDMHMLTGSSVFGMELEEVLAMKKIAKPGSPKEVKVKQIRQGGKAGNFGLLYGMQVNGFRTYARTTYGVDLTEPQAFDFREGYFNRFTKILPWHAKAKMVAHRNEAIVSPLGRVRHLPLINARDNSIRAQAERQAVNSPVQATLSDLGLLAIGILAERYPQLWVFGFTHDDISAYVPENEVELWADRIKDVMENLPLEELFGWKPQLQFLVDAEASTENLGALKEL